MKRLSNLLVIGFLLTHTLYAQEGMPTSSTDIHSQHSAAISLWSAGLGYSYEQKIAPAISIAVNPYLVMSGYSPSLGVLLQTGVNLEGRYYYNRQKRLSRQKKLQLNAGNFLGMSLRYMYVFYPDLHNNTPNRDNHYLHFPAIFWGMRRPLNDKIWFELSLGLQNRVMEGSLPILAPPTFSFEAFTDARISIFPYVSLRFGYAFHEGKKK